MNPTVYHRFFCLYLLLCIVSLGWLEASSRVHQPFDQRFIVKLNPEHAPSLSTFRDQLQELGFNHSLFRDFTKVAPDVFYGASIRLEEVSDIKAISRLQGVVAVTPVERLKPINPVSQKVLLKPLRTAGNPRAYAPHVQTRVSDLHAMGYYGRGIKVALIDSGIDCDHPAFGGFGPGHKISFGYDLVGDDYDGSSSPKPDSNPCTPCAVHGTHTAGIVGAADLGFGFQGVVPNATLGSYRVMGCDSSGGTSNDLVIQAFLMAVRDGANVISASIGGVGGWSKGDALSDVINRLTANGATIILAAGNEGSEGMFYAESPAAAVGSMAIGSVESLTSMVTKMRTSSGKELGYESTDKFSGRDYPLYAVSLEPTVQEDACQPLPDSVPELSSFVVLIRRGGCTFAKKAENVGKKGAKRILFYMNTAENASIATMGNILTASVSKNDGEMLLEDLHNNPGLKISFPEGLFSFKPTPRGGFVSNFSQYGPSYDFRNLQPNFLGVGGKIVSTVPVRNGKFAVMSGTSMATPQVAGIAALVKSIRGDKISPQKLKRLFSTTSQQVFSAPGTTDIETVSHQGGGLVDAFCAAFANTSLSTDVLTLNDVDHFKGEQSFTIFNDGPKTFSYKVGHMLAHTVSTFRSGESKVSTDVQVMSGVPGASVQLSPQSFTLGPRASQTIKLRFKRPELDRSRLPVYSGYIALVTDADCETHTLPYYGVAGSLKAQKIIEIGKDTGSFSNLDLPRLTDSARRPAGSQSFSFKNDQTCNLRYRFAFGSSYTRVDIVEANARFRKQIPTSRDSPKNVDFGSTFVLVRDAFLGAKLVGMVPTSNSTYNSRTAVDDTIVQRWDGKVLPPGKNKAVDVPNGAYKMLLRALRVNGNPYNDDDYDMWLSPTVQVKR